MRYYRRVGRRSGVSMGIGTYLVGWFLLICLVIGALQALAGKGTIIGLILLGVSAVCVLSVVLQERRRSAAIAAKIAKNKAQLEAANATRLRVMDEARRLVDQAAAPETGRAERRILIAHAKDRIFDRADDRIDLARYIDQKSG